MSGIAAVVRLDGGPVDAPSLARVAGAMAFRGPDGVESRCFGPAGLACALLRVRGEAESKSGIETLDGETCIAADARLDARGELFSALGSEGVRVGTDATDGELILLAYRAWGDGCVHRLLGDFAFALWDGPRRRLLCARDHLGVKPFYHAVADGTLVAGNTVDAILAHPGVSPEPSVDALADWLAHGWFPDPASTAYRSISALPPAHVLSAEAGEVRIRKFWSLPTDTEPLVLRRPEEYAERFREVLGEAVRDRLRGEPAAILLSGGLDSTTVAAVSTEALSSTDALVPLRAFTGVSGALVPDRETRYARMAADALGIPIRIHDVDGYLPFERWGTEELRRPEPMDDPLLAFTADHLEAIGRTARVCLTGEGGDAVMRESASRLARLALRGKLAAAVREAVGYLRVHGRLPRPGIRTLLRHRSSAGRWRVDVPRWMTPDAAEGVRRRAAQRVDAPAHPLRPEAYARVADPFWAAYLPQYDPGFTRCAVEFRHPLLDLRVIGLALSIPPAQWYNDKGLMKVAMRGRLPRAVLRRRKAPFAGDLLAAHRARGGNAWLDGRRLGGELAALVDARAVPADAGGLGGEPSHDLSTDLRPLCLALWLRSGPT